jgi:UDP-N-acetylglucosamine 1-carboxyvinyltransferase
MEKMIVQGGRSLQGVIKISGAKNSALPIMAASLLPSQGKTELLNVPRVSDVDTIAEILRKLGLRVELSGGRALIGNGFFESYMVPLVESKKMRASSLLAGPLLAKFGRVMMTEPGGCVIGNRPIDMHLEALKGLGAKVEKVDNQYFRIEASFLKGNRIHLLFPSVGVTENLLMASCLARGHTIIENAAREPEIVDLANFLIAMGAKIKGHGSSVVRIDGVKELESVTYSIIPDRIETGTYIVAAAITHGDVLLRNADLEILQTEVSKLLEAGVEIRRCDEGVRVASRKAFSPANIVTEVYPGFSTDMQPIMTTLCSIADGQSRIKETIFERRFNNVPELRKMGAEISILDDTLAIKGVKRLNGAEVEALDIRSGASLLLAGLIAEGETSISGVDKIYRGYEDPVLKLKNVGAELHSLDQ